MNAVNYSHFRNSTAAVTLAGIPVNTYQPINDNSQAPAGPLTASVSRADLTAALDKLRRVVERRYTIPILSNVSMVAAHGEMTLVATDLDAEITVTIPAGKADNFKATAPCQLLHDIMKKAAKSEAVAFKMDEEFQVANVSFAALEYRLQTRPVADFPVLSPVQYSHRFDIPGKELFTMLDAVSVAISTEETRYYLNGIFLHVAEDHANKRVGADPTDPDRFASPRVLRTTATDGHRCYVQDMALPYIYGDADMPAVIIPRAIVKLMLDLTKGKACPESVRVSIWRQDLDDRLAGGAGQIRFEFGNVSIRSKLVDGTFPDYGRVIPTYNQHTVRFDRDAMAEALASVTVVSSVKGRAVKFCLEDGYCQLLVNNPDSGSARATIEGVSWIHNQHADEDKRGRAADPLEIGYNAGYMQALLDDAGAGEIVAHISDAGSPAVFHGSATGWKAVLMPMRV